MTKEELVKALLYVAVIDGKLEQEEKDLLSGVCGRLGVPLEVLNQWLNEIISQKGGVQIAIPQSVEECVFLVRSMVQMTAVDGEIDNRELSLLLAVAKHCGLAEEVVTNMTREELARSSKNKPGPCQGLPPQGQQQPAQAKADIALSAGQKKLVVIAVLAVAAGVGAWNWYLRDYVHYRNVLSANTAEACSGYLGVFPEGHFAKKVRILKDDLSFGNARNMNSADAYEMYMEKFAPNGRHIGEARELGEPLRYAAVMQFLTLEKLGEYIAKYPEGKHLPEIKALQERLFYEGVARSRSLAGIRKFMEDRPQSRYNRDLEALKDQIWNGAINSYLRNAKAQSADNKASQFFRAMLTHMRVTGDTTLNLVFENSVDVKDWEDFSKKVHATWDKVIDVVNSQNAGNTFEPQCEYPTAKPPPSLKKSFDSGNVNLLEGQIADRVQGYLRDMFSEDYFRIYRHRIYPHNRGKEIGGVTMKLKYSIRNKYNKIAGENLPSLYQQYASQMYGGLNKRFEGHLLGIRIDWDVTLNIAGTSYNYRLAETSYPATSIEGVGNVSDVYSTMTSMAFKDFADKLAAVFGIGARKK
ncbi:MAG: hypothetical protein Q7R35_10720 [Elusimicrobiota bacterium]|nr:hypothetical protein [Elusimicrobiota bacterium]